MLSLAAWARFLAPWWLAAAGAGVVASLVGGEGRRRRDTWGGAARILLLVGIVAGFSGEWQLARLSSRWPGARTGRVVAVETTLRHRLDALVSSGEAAAGEAAAVAAGGSLAPPFRELRRIARSREVDALAVFGPDGGLEAWTGEHRGPVPAAVRSGRRSRVFGERPLFSYLYVVEPVPERGGVAVAVLLLEADLPGTVASAPGTFSAAFEEEVGVPVRLHRGGVGSGGAPAAWALEDDGRVVLAADAEAPSQALMRSRSSAPWRLGAVAAALLAFVAALVAWRKGDGRRIWLPAAGAVGLAAVLPFGLLPGVGELFTPVTFVLPGPRGLTLGRILALELGLVAAAGFAGVRSGVRPPALGAALIGGGSVLALEAMRSAAAVEFLAGRPILWLAHQLAEVLLIALIAGVLLPVRNREWSPEARRLAVVAGVGLTLLLPGLVLLEARVTLHEPEWLALLWAFPAYLLGRGGGTAEDGFRGSSVRWVAAVWLAGTLVLPFHWVERTSARQEIAEAELSRLGTRADPYLEFLLHRVGPVADSLHRAGARDVDLLYSTWLETGLAAEDDPLWMTLRSPAGEPAEELAFGVEAPRPLVERLLPDTLPPGATEIRRHETVPRVHYLAHAGLPDGSIISVVVPPRRRLGPLSPLAPLFAVRGPAGEPVALLPGAPGPGEEAGEVRWHRTERGWRGEVSVRFPDGWHRAFYALEMPGAGVVLARAVLLLLLDLAVAVAAWTLGRGVRRGLPVAPGAVAGGLASFRARITGALLLFFLVPTLVFGSFAYRTIAGEAERTARSLAERTLDEAELESGTARWGRAGELGRPGADLLLYRDGTLVAGPSREVVELGLFRSWVPPRVVAALEEGAVNVADDRDALGDWRYLVAYRPLPDDRIAGAPVALGSGRMEERSRELFDLLAFAVLLGVVVSLALSVVAGRALAGPIRELRSAAERIGAGDLEVALPEERGDEFGTLFGAFNRMTARLRRARRALTRARRRTETIVEESATGVLALDPEGLVTLANRRAVRLLGGDVRRGASLPEAGPVAREIRSWTSALLAGREPEAERIVEEGRRRIRIRARRILGGPEPGGVVVNLEDVTDELRSERILAWGEMAKQVAHEVKNPLTPIQLSVQHIRRAYEDARPDFGEILRRNVDAVLREIERLSTIVAGFSSFAAPGTAEGRPLEPVDVDAVVEETLALYAGGGGEISYAYEAGGELPPAAARRDELKEVLVNLLENARTAIDGSGRVVIEARPRDSGVELRVRDTGPGIPAEIVEKVFEPHFSTRSSGGGLGLAIVQRLVESWGGSVGVETGEGEGSTVRIRMGGWEDAGGAPEGG